MRAGVRSVSSQGRLAITATAFLATSAGLTWQARAYVDVPKVSAQHLPVIWTGPPPEEGRPVEPHSQHPEQHWKFSGLQGSGAKAWRLGIAFASALMVMLLPMDAASARGGFGGALKAARAVKPLLAATSGAARQQVMRPGHVFLASEAVKDGKSELRDRQNQEKLGNSATVMAGKK